MAAGLAKALRARAPSPASRSSTASSMAAKKPSRRRKSSQRTAVLTILKAALNHAFRDGLSHVRLRLAQGQTLQRRRRGAGQIFTIVEATRIINASDPEFRPLVQAALQTGCRYGELARLEVTDFNPDSGTLAIRQVQDLARSAMSC